ncbi:hypothetical protein HG549_15310 [Pseudomonas sp. SK]|nr:hypothetical protein [Pseudomonas sp. SK]QJQ21245.1 hypothetical protein HG549_15310 [Pseudomonas sp. SK]
MQAQSWDPAGRLLKATSRLGVETFAFDPAGNLLDDKAQELNRPLESDPRRNKLMDNLLREYAGTHYQYDERSNLILEGIESLTRSCFRRIQMQKSKVSVTCVDLTDGRLSILIRENIGVWIR